MDNSIIIHMFNSIINGIPLTIFKAFKYNLYTFKYTNILNNLDICVKTFLYIKVRYGAKIRSIQLYCYSSDAIKNSALTFQRKLSVLNNRKNRLFIFNTF